MRRVLVEAAWPYRHQARKTEVLQRRAERTTEEVQENPMEGAKALVPALSRHAGEGQAESAGLDHRGVRTGRLYLDSRADSATTSGKGIRLLYLFR